MKVVSFLNMKGGVGKSTCLTNISMLYAKENPDKKVLVLDGDAQANTTTMIGLSTTSNSYNSIVTIVEDNIKPEDIVLEGVNPLYPNLYLIPSNIDAIKLEPLLNTLPAKEFIFARWFERNEEYFSQFDIMFIDVNPSLSVLNQALLYMTTDIVIVTEYGDINSVFGASMFMSLWEEIKYNLGKYEDDIKGLIVNKKENRSKLGKQWLEYVNSTEYLKSLLLDITLSNTVLYKNSLLENKSIVDYKPNHKASEEMLGLYKELISKDII